MILKQFSMLIYITGKVRSIGWTSSGNLFSDTDDPAIRNALNGTTEFIYDSVASQDQRDFGYVSKLKICGFGN